MFQICKETCSFEFWHRLDTQNYEFFEKNPKIAIFYKKTKENRLFLDFSPKIHIFQCPNDAKTKKQVKNPDV